METLTEHQTECPPQSQRTTIPDHDLVHELSMRLDAVCRYAECIANAVGDADVQQTWRDLEQQELNNITRLKQLIVRRIQEGEFLEDIC
jgi:hypothetical protein